MELLQGHKGINWHRGTRESTVTGTYTTTSGVVRLDISDHFGIFASRASNKAMKGNQDHLMIEYRDFKAFDETKFLEDVDSAPWSLIDIYDDINDKVDIFYQLINQLLDWHAPKRQKRIRKESYPWIICQVIESIRKKLLHFRYSSKIKPT